MLLKQIALFAAVAPFALADVEFTSPAAGASLAPGTISVKWKDSGDAPSISDLASYQLFLCAGGNDDDSYIQLAPIQQQGEFTTGNAASGTIQANIGASTKNAYFLKMLSVGTAGGQVTNFSPRFSLTGMTGTFPQSVLDGLKDVKGTDGPPTVNNVGKTPAGGTNAAAGAWGTPYSLQTGLTKYAPMQKQPPTKITAQSASPLFPTSAFSVAKTWLPTPSQVTTITQSGTYSVKSMENTAAAASQPSDDMAKYLARWKD